MKYPILGALTFFLASIFNSCLASEIKYKFSDIPEELKRNAKSVIRKDLTSFVIVSESEATLNIEYSVTVLNKNGLNDAMFTKFYDRFSKVKNIKIVLYNSDGEIIKHYHASDIMDLSAKAGYSLYEENRVKYLNPEFRTYPFTFEYSCEIDYTGILDYPNWYIYPENNVSVQQSSITVSCPKDLKLRYFEQNLPVKAEITENKGETLYHCEVNNLPALKEEPFSTSFISNVPVVYFAPNDFEIGGSRGNSESWLNLGLWIKKLNEKRDILIPGTIQKLKELTKGANSEEQKIAILYKYMQDKTRYVNISIGLGGWQPFEATVVDRLSYGDCKALTNYMKSILSAVDIKSYYTLVRAGDDAEPILTQFPSSQFNHVILCVPVKNDTMWLECTSQQIPCGYEGRFTDDRDVLLVNETGGHIVHTKCYSQSENHKIQKASIAIDEEGNGAGTVCTLYSGLNYDVMENILYSDDQDKKKIISNRIHIPAFKLLKISETLNSDRIPKVHETLELELPNYANKVGDRMVISLNLMDKRDLLSGQTGARKSDIQIRRSLEETDSITYILPKAYKADRIPDPIRISTIFGEYNLNVQLLSNDRVLYIRNFSLKKGRHAASLFGEFKNFFEKVSGYDNNMKLIIRKEGT